MSGAETRATFVHAGVMISVKHGDLTEQNTEAIVCPGNSYCHMRGGVAKAIRSKGGDEIETEARSRAPVRLGSAIGTSGGRLKAQRVYHAPTMKDPVETAKPKNVEAAARAAFRLARREQIASISVPGMGTGTGGLSYIEGARILVRVLCEELGTPIKLQRVDLVAFAVGLADRLSEELESVLGDRAKS